MQRDELPPRIDELVLPVRWAGCAIVLPDFTGTRCGDDPPTAVLLASVQHERDSREIPCPQCCQLPSELQRRLALDGAIGAAPERVRLVESYMALDAHSRAIFEQYILSPATLLPISCRAPDQRNRAQQRRPAGELVHRIERCCGSNESVELTFCSMTFFVTLELFFIRCRRLVQH